MSNRLSNSLRVVVLSTRLSFLLVGVVFSMEAFGQGIYQMWGTAPYGYLSPNSAGFFRFDPVERKFPGLGVIRKPALPAGSLSKVFEFADKVYGISNSGGLNNVGFIFEWDPESGALVNRGNFSAGTGRGVNGQLTYWNGKFYGVTQYGGINERGMLFEWDPASGTITGKIPFSEALGYAPCESLVLKDGKLYGFTSLGGTGGRGGLFEWDPDLNLYNRRNEFGPSSGYFPVGKLTLLNGKFYGINADGGTNNVGTFFEWDPVTSNLTPKLNRTMAGGYGRSELTVKDNKFYGTASYGGAHDMGTVFEWDPVTNHFQKKMDFPPNSGNEPLGLTVFNDKFYGITSDPEFYQTTGALFEWDPATNQFTKMQELTQNTLIGMGAYRSLSVIDGKLYGTTFRGGYRNLGSLFEWDPNRNIATAKVKFGENEGTPQANSMTSVKGKFYGVMREGGANNRGVIFEWNPVTRVFNKEFDFSTSVGAYPKGGLTLFNGKLYGTTESGGTNNQGVIFEWDPVDKIYVKKMDLQFSTGNQLTDFSVVNGKFFGIARGGTQNGGIFEWDPVNDLFTIKYSFDWALFSSGVYHKLITVDDKLYGNSSEGKLFEWDPLANGFSIVATIPEGTAMENGLIWVDGKLYGITYNGGFYGKGILFALDPVTRLVTKKADLPLSPAVSFFAHNRTFYVFFQNGDWFEWSHGDDAFTHIDNMGGYDVSGPIFLSSVAAPVATFPAGECTYAGSCKIGTVNSNVWVPVIDETGNAVAEINANGNELGLVTVDGYIHHTATREGGGHRLYLDRNLTITPENPHIAAGAPVSVRFYIKKEEYEKLKTSTNSLGQLSGVGAPEDIGVFSNPSNECAAVLESTVLRIENSTVESWGEDYVLTAQIESFSSFYFGAKEFSSLPVSLVSFSASYTENFVRVNWKTTSEIKVSHFEVERSKDGRKFETVDRVAANSQVAGSSYQVVDAGITDVPGIFYYRLKSIDEDGGFSYSSVVSVKITGDLQILPNPVEAHLLVSGENEGFRLWEVVDMTGRVVLKGDGATGRLDVRGVLPGVYILRLTGRNSVKAIRFVKK